MPVFRVEKNKNYTVMSNYHLRDTGLSLKAMGMLSLMLSLPDSWDYTLSGLEKLCKDGSFSVSSTLKELETKGYLTRSWARDAMGKITDIEYTIYENPTQPIPENPRQEKPYLGNPETDNPETGKPDAGNQTQLNTIYKEILNKRNTDLSISIDRIEDTLKKNIEYDALIKEYGTERVDEIVDLMLDPFMTDKNTFKIGSRSYPTETVRSRMQKLDLTHIEYVFECLDNTHTQIKDIRSYILTALYNAPGTIGSYYSAQVRSGA